MASAAPGLNGQDASAAPILKATIRALLLISLCSLAVAWLASMWLARKVARRVAACFEEVSLEDLCLRAEEVGVQRTASGAIVLNVVAATLAGYGLTRLPFPGKKTFAFGTLFSYMFPPMLMAIPLYIMFSALGMRNTYTGLILAHMALSLPLNIWLMWQYFQNVPQTLEEAAACAGPTMPTVASPAAAARRSRVSRVGRAPPPSMRASS